MEIIADAAIKLRTDLEKLGRANCTIKCRRTASFTVGVHQGARTIEKVFT